MLQRKGRRTSLITKTCSTLEYSLKTLTATLVFDEISVRPTVLHHQVFSAGYSLRYFNNASRSSDGLKNDLSFCLFAILKSLAVVEYNEGKVSYATTITKYRIRVTRPNQELCCHPNMGVAYLDRCRYLKTRYIPEEIIKLLNCYKSNTQMFY